MRNKLSRTAYSVFTLFLLIAVKVNSRLIRYSSSSDLISDGVDHVQDNQPNYLVLKGENSSEYQCEQLYGFLPCSYTSAGFLFLIVVYEFLLFHGESYVASGGERIFKILGPGIFGASAFHVLGSLPESLILLASGLLNSKETAQEYVYTGVGLLAGSTIFNLTLVWGTCVIIGSQDLSNKSKPNPSATSSPEENLFKRFLSFLKGHGITTDMETRYTARIMVLSLIPFIIIQIPKVFNLSYTGERIFIIITLVISFVFLFLYFFYQMFEPSIQKRRLEYIKHEHLVVDVLRHVQKHAMGRLLTEDGSPNVITIRRLFEEVDQDGDKMISFAELKNLLYEIKYKRWNVDRDMVVAKVLKEFDVNSDKKITMDEFVNGFTKWLDEAKHAMDQKYHSVKSYKDLYQILEPWIHKKKKEHELKKQLLSEILGHVQSSAIGNLYTADGTPHTPTIKRLFEKIDQDKDDCISQSELKELVVEINFRNIPLDTDEAVEKIMEELNLTGDQTITEEVFVTGFKRLLNANNDTQTPNSKESEDDINQKNWEEIDMLVEDRTIYASTWAWIKAIVLLVVGISMLAVLAEPLINSVQHFSKAASVSSFFVSFILVPLATNARNAISAITAASRKKPRTTSLTVSEIYGAVFMNNILGFCVLLSLVYFRGFSWNFAAEVLVVLIVCAIMGVNASFSSTFPVWTSLVAFLLYPLSLIMVSLLDTSFWWH